MEFPQKISRSETNALYAETLRLQTDLYRHETRTFLSALRNWKGATRILDVGCGPGAFAESIGDLIGDREYLGIDVAADFIKLADRFATKKIKFQCENVFDFNDAPFDIVIGWAVLQHLLDVKKALERFQHFLKRGGCLVLFDGGQGEEIRATPDLPTLRKMYRYLSGEEARKKRDDRCLDSAKLSAPDFGLGVAMDKNADIPIVSLAEKQTFIQYVLNVSELLKRFYGNDVSQNQLVQELEDWRAAKGASANLTGGRWLVLEKL